ncbi:hypothetical protein ACI01nite_17120 [Acetobacter cibinongensis]|uniref:Transposase n=1 Tax=Acetobacter cibinongensis TaxID=146475 RepID=A0A0D6N1C8_9PROT|nr:hypothetical protein Abci_003_126 [Acetobacter cibinongensis]GBQ13582.1 hypothetical protein AA0482_0644 [Acetobacter cibinongensis NRIC 0482]GEL59110.1 hypothetical protein ACI01nite_17120 [Acetobacter cibinongensis]
MKQPGVFDMEERLACSRESGAQLDGFSQIVESEVFRPDLGLSGLLPDAKTVCLFRESLTQAGEIDSLFNRHDAISLYAGYSPMPSQMLKYSSAVKSVIRFPVESIFADQKLQHDCSSGHKASPVPPHGPLVGAILHTGKNGTTLKLEGRS